MKRPLITTAIALLLALPAAAQARTITVGPGQSIADALNSSADGDTIHVLPGAYVEPPMSVAHAVRVEGEAGTSVTTTDASKPLFTVSHAGATIASLSATSAGEVVLSQAPDLVIDGASLTRTAGGDVSVVEVGSTPTTGTTTISRSLIVNATAGTGHASPAVLGGPSNSLAISDTLIVSGAGEGPGVRFAGGSADSLVRSSVAAIQSGSDAVQIQSTGAGAKALAIDSSILSGGASAVSLRASTSNAIPGSATGDITITATHATIAGAATAFAADAAANGGVSPVGSIAITADRSIVRGTSTTATCTSCPLAANTATVSVTKSDTSAADVFVNAGAKNFHLRADAPDIDQGGPAVSGESDRDVDGQPRVVGAASDLGADEFVNQAPVGRLAAPGQVRTPGAATLDASTSSDPEAGWGGGIRSYHFDFGDGSGADSATPVVTHTYARPGVYAATVTVTDVQGLAGSPSEPAQVRVVDGIAPTARIIAPRNGRKLRLFAKHHKLAPIRFTGSAADDVGVAAVGLTLQRIGTTRVTKIAVRVQQGIWSYKVSRRLKLKRGRYELKAYAVDAAGNVSAPARVRFTLK